MAQSDTVEDQIRRRDHWRKPDRDDRGPESRLLPVEERDGTHTLAPWLDGSPCGSPTTPQTDDPHGKGYVGTAPRWERPVPGARERLEAPHPDDPDGLGYHGTTQEDRYREEAARVGIERPERENISAVTHPYNAAPKAAKYANVPAEEAA